MPKFVLCAKRLFRIGPSQGLVRNVKCLRRKRALSDTFFELGPINMAENWYRTEAECNVCPHSVHFCM